MSEDRTGVRGRLGAPSSGDGIEVQHESGEEPLIGADDVILVTGATGFLGSRVVRNLAERGFRNVRCLVRSIKKAEKLSSRQPDIALFEVMEGNLLSKEDCICATKDAKVILHLAAGRGEKSFPEAFLNSVVTTRNLLEASVQHQCLLRFVNVSSFAVYTNKEKPKGRLLDESCPIETHAELRHEAYCFAKVKQDEIVAEYGKRFDIPYVIVRPGHVYGPGNEAITGRVGINPFGLFLHLGGSNRIPFTYVDNCADAIVLSGLKRGIDGSTFNVVDDKLPSSRKFLRMYKRNVKSFHSIYLPHAVSYGICYVWEKYSGWSEGQLPAVYNRGKWNSFWKKTEYSNEKLKRDLGWAPKVPMDEGLRRYFESCRALVRHA